MRWSVAWNAKAVFFMYGKDSMHTKAKSGLIQQYLEFHCELPDAGAWYFDWPFCSVDSAD